MVKTSAQLKITLVFAGKILKNIRVLTHQNFNYAYFLKNMIVEILYAVRKKRWEWLKIQIFAYSSNISNALYSRNKLTMIAEPLEKGLAEDIEAGKVQINWDK